MMKAVSEQLTEWLSWPQAIAWLQHGDTEVLQEIGSAMEARILDGLCTSTARIASILLGDERRMTAPGYPTSNDAETCLLDRLKRGQVSAQGRPRPGGNLEAIPTSEWQCPRLHWSATVDLGPAAYPNSVLYYDIRVARDGLAPLWSMPDRSQERLGELNPPALGGKWADRVPGRKTVLLFEFFAWAKDRHMAGGSDPKNPTALRRAYRAWLGKRASKEVPYAREAFERWLARCEHDWWPREDGRGFEYLPR
jgi:hypothetical protein